jgi:hypothetical protein
VSYHIRTKSEEGYVPKLFKSITPEQPAKKDMLQGSWCPTMFQQLVKKGNFQERHCPIMPEQHVKKNMFQERQCHVMYEERVKKAMFRETWSFNMSEHYAKKALFQEMRCPVMPDDKTVCEAILIPREAMSHHA